MHGAFCSEKYGSVEEMCYQNARSLLEHAEMSSEGASFLTIESLQTCLLIAVYEIKRKYFTRAYISLGRALRLAQLMKCHLLDSDQAVRAAAIKGSVGEWPLPQPIPLAAWLEVEEKRRVFWVGFVLDRCMNSGQDWPMMLEDNKVCCDILGLNGGSLGPNVLFFFVVVSQVSCHIQLRTPFLVSSA